MVVVADVILKITKIILNRIYKEFKNTNNYIFKLFLCFYLTFFSGCRSPPVPFSLNNFFN